MYKAIRSIIALVCSSRALLVGSLGSLRCLRVGGSRRLLGVLRWVRVAHEVSLGCITSRVLLLLGVLTLPLLTSLCLWWENGIRKGRRCGRIGSIIKLRAVVVVVEVQMEPVAIVLHLEYGRDSCRPRNRPRGLVLRGQDNCL